MEMSTNENSENSTISSNDVDHQHDNLVPNLLNHGVAESMCELAEEEAKGILELIASTGKFWHDWDKLKSLLSFQLKQVLSEYPEAKVTNDQHNSALGESFQELMRRLDEALCSFIEGPPFTLQRLCEILLTAQSIYPNLSKLALALEKNWLISLKNCAELSLDDILKNLLVTSTLTMCTDSYPPTMIQKVDEPDKEIEEPQPQPQPQPQPYSNSVANGVEPMVADRDEIMAEVEEAEIDDDMTIDMEAFEEIVASSETSSMPTGSS